MPRYVKMEDAWYLRADRIVKLRPGNPMVDIRDPATDEFVEVKVFYSPTEGSFNYLREARTTLHELRLAGELPRVANNDPYRNHNVL